MPPDTILVNVSLLRRNPGKQTDSLCGQTPHIPGYPSVRNLPLHLPAATTATLEGTTWPEYRVFGRLGASYNFEVRVDISTQHASAELLRSARLAVAAIDFPAGQPRRPAERTWAENVTLRRSRVADHTFPFPFRAATACSTSHPMSGTPHADALG